MGGFEESDSAYETHAPNFVKASPDTYTYGLCAALLVMVLAHAPAEGPAGA